jgi:hypothetical protein
MKRTSLAIALCTATLLWALPVRATFHVAVVDEVFPGFADAPDAQYVIVRFELALQNVVHGQPLKTFDAAGQESMPFGAFCPTRAVCDLPRVSPACSGGGCPQAIQFNDRSILVATPRAADLFCVTPDLLATGTLPYPDGRVCWGDCDLSTDCGSGPVDCAAYGAFTGNNDPFGTPAMSPMLGAALVGAPARQGQYSLTLDAAAVCAGGDHGNQSCASGDDCPNGTCVGCPDGSCRNLLNDAIGFSSGKPTPRNLHGDLGNAGLPGDSEGSGVLEPDDVAGVVEVMFEFADRRCAPTLDPSRRGADANLDTLINAADIIATIKIVAASGAA